MKLPELESIYRAEPSDQIQMVNEGVGAYLFGELASSIELSTEDLAKAVGLNARTLRNRKVAKAGSSRSSKRLSGDETERAFRVYRVLRRAEEVLGDADAAASWLNTPQKALGEKTPLSFLSRDVGTEEVLNVLLAIEYGVYL
jgi:putative toxin-antitoxin system antitoxin component (TIGR02293 family)